MLQFNLSKEDRVNIHARIASSQVSPGELSTMSSTDLATDEIKQSIKQAEEEALAHSILKKATLPRAKMTHKGMQDIEDVNGSGRERERDQAQEEDEDRMERERVARLRVQTQRAQNQAQEGSSSVPPESPSVAQQTPTWGGPPPLPSHANDPSPSPTSARTLTNPLFASEMLTSPVEGELNLDELINIDDDPTSDAMSLSITIPSPPSPVKAIPSLEATQNRPPAVQTPASTTALSPFAAKPSPSLVHRPSFDLNALWTPRDDASASDVAEDQPSEVQDYALSEEPRELTPTIDIDMGENEPADQDFDMFLTNNDDILPAPEQPLPDDSPEGQNAAFEALPKVWNGTVRVLMYLRPNVSDSPNFCHS